MGEAVASGETLVEEFFDQHPDMASLAPECVNTVRVITRQDQRGGTVIVATILRLWAGEPIDNFDAGGVSVALGPDSGRPTNRPVFKNPFDRELASDSRLAVRLKSFVVPYWDGVLELVSRASRMCPALGTAGWDVAIGRYGPELIEVNDNWDKTHWQVSEGRGLAGDFVSWPHARDLANRHQRRLGIR